MNKQLISLAASIGISAAAWAQAGTITTNGTLTVTWTAPVADATHSAPAAILVMRGLSASALSQAALLSPTATTYTDTGLATATYYYSLISSNSIGTAASSVVSATTRTPPAITTQPVSISGVVGQSVQFSIAASGTGTLAFQWYVGSTPITGATSATYAFTVSAGSAGNYTCVVSNSGGSNQSNAASLTLIYPPAAPTNLVITVP